MFSGSNRNKILSVIEEIKETFFKFLNKINQMNKSKILDIKSTQWHDVYNNFKFGMKNLDNMYINLINLAFDKVKTVQQSIEYMDAFKSLALRSSIKNYVFKKLEKVNEIFLKELKVVEDFSKKKAPFTFWFSKHSSKSLWLYHLIIRIEDLY